MSKKIAVICMILIAVSLAATALVYGKMPEKIATNFNIRGEAAGFSPRWMVFVLGGFFPALLLGIFAVIPKLDPRRESYTKHKKAYEILCVAVTIFLLIIQWIIVAAAFGKKIPAAAVIMSLTGILIAVLGNFLPQVRPNYTFGIKLPWTLASEDNWRATHRVGGWSFTLGGLLMAVSAFIPQPASPIAFFTALAALVLVPAVYSYKYYKKHAQN